MKVVKFNIEEIQGSKRGAISMKIFFIISFKWVKY